MAAGAKHDLGPRGALGHVHKVAALHAGPKLERAKRQVGRTAGVAADCGDKGGGIGPSRGTLDGRGGEGQCWEGSVGRRVWRVWEGNCRRGCWYGSVERRVWGEWEGIVGGDVGTGVLGGECGECGKASVRGGVGMGVLRGECGKEIVGGGVGRKGWGGK
eukprot:222152-Chlamydomonas_euryale.AAC.1